MYIYIECTSALARYRVVSRGSTSLQAVIINEYDVYIGMWRNVNRIFTTIATYSDTNVRIQSDFLYRQSPINPSTVQRLYAISVFSVRSSVMRRPLSKLYSLFDNASQYEHNPVRCRFKHQHWAYDQVFPFLYFIFYIFIFLYFILFTIAVIIIMIFYHGLTTGIFFLDFGRYKIVPRYLYLGGTFKLPNWKISVRYL